MSATEKWNIIVEQYSRNVNSPEDIIHGIWEQIFAEFFGYSRLSGEIESKRTIRIGSSGSIEPDIIIKNSNTDLFVVELKRHNYIATKNMELQLQSYLRQLQKSIGILICNKIYVFAGEENAVIEFTPDNPDGVKFIEIFGKGKFDEQAVKEFVHQKIKFHRTVARIKEEWTRELEFDLVRKYFADKYGAAEFERANNELKAAPKLPPEESPASPVKPPEKNRVTRYEARKICTSNGLNIGEHNFRYANRYSHRETYHIDPKFELLSKNWWMLLVDPLARKLYAFEIPADSLSKEKFKPLPDKIERFRLRIKCDDDFFTDLNSRIKFKQWLVKTIDFS